MVLLLFALHSAIGIFMFFIPITLNGARSIPLDHMVTTIKEIPNYYLVYGLFMGLAGVIYPAWSKPRTTSARSLVCFLLQILSLVFAFMFVTKRGPAGLHEPGMLPSSGMRSWYPLPPSFPSVLFSWPSSRISA